MSSLASEYEMERPVLRDDREGLDATVQTMLRAQGLYPKEAAAMLKPGEIRGLRKASGFSTSFLRRWSTANSR
ncbi:MAG TPA: hypothetical protein VM120_25550 [Bryobacteraceae bacterium]|nr:hypothetical protein [Bryobacteraceae bacterium]